MGSLGLLSGGAAKGLVLSLSPVFRARTGFDITGEFGAVGAMADKLRKGASADVVIFTAGLVAKLAEEGLLSGSSISDIGRVETALAVRSRDRSLSIADAAGLRRAFLAADAIFVPDTKASTAGIHVAKVLAELGIAEAVAARLKIYPNGATAMSQLATSDAARPIGCTQATEIVDTEGVELSGSLPPGYDLATMYTAAVTTGARGPAQALCDLLTSVVARAARTRAGFLS